MSAFHGPQERALGARGRNKGALARYRDRKRMAAEIRNEMSAPERRRAARLAGDDR